jgi:APA family basic amino acid/polyamine antiporter
MSLRQAGVERLRDYYVFLDANERGTFINAIAVEPGKWSSRGSLLRVLGTAFALAVAIGTTMGGGILYAPGKIAALLPNTWLYMAVWVIGGINALLGATVFAELGAMIPLSGGPYPFARRALGDYAGFVVGYTQWMLDCASDAALLLLIGEYSYVLLPALAGHAVAVASATLAVLTAANWRSVRSGGRIQIGTTVAKTLALAIVIGAAFLMPHAPAAAGATFAATPHGVTLIVALILAMQGVIFAYDSYYVPIFFGEELHDPGREIPRAIFRGLLVTIGMYLLLNAAFLWVLPVARMANEPFVGGVAAEAVFGAHGDQVIRIIVIISVLGTTNAGVLMTARVLLTMARDGLFAHQAARVNAGGTPTVALLLSTVVTAAFLVSGTFGAVLGVIALLIAMNYLLIYISLVVLRRREPETPRPYRAWGYPWTTAIAILIGIAFIVGVALSDPHNSAIALVILLASYPLFRGTRRLFQHRP